MTDLRAMVEADLDRMKDAFLRVDREQGAIRATVEDYARLLPDRAAMTTIVARHAKLAERADAAVMAYLDLVEAYPPASELQPPRLQQAGSSYARLAGQLNELADEYEAFMSSALGELSRIGERKARADELQRRAREALVRAHDAWTALREQGMESEEVDRLLARARVTGRAMEAWTATEGVDRLEGLAAETADLSEQTVAAAGSFPERVARVRRRQVSLRTRTEAVRTRMEACEEDLRTLRRSYRAPNWLDLEQSRQSVASLLDEVAQRQADLDAAVAASEWDRALALVDELEALLERADDTVDAPRERIQRIRSLQADPSGTLDRVRFAVRDAQMLVMSGPPQRLREFGPRLDRLAVRIDRARTALEGDHPDYWPVLADLDKVTAEVAGLVAGYREATRP